MRKVWGRSVIPEGEHPFWEFLLGQSFTPRLRYLAYLHAHLGRWNRVARYLRTTSRTLFRWIKEDQET